MGLKIRRNEDLDAMFKNFTLDNPSAPDPNKKKNYLKHQTEADKKKAAKNKILKSDKTKK